MIFDCRSRSRSRDKEKEREKKRSDKDKDREKEKEKKSSRRSRSKEKKRSKWVFYTFLSVVLDAASVNFNITNTTFPQIKRAEAEPISQQGEETQSFT